MPNSIGSFSHSAGDTRNRGLDYTRDLWAGETLSAISIPNVTGVTITGAAVNVATFLNDDGATVAIGAGVLFKAATPTAGTYTLTATATTSTGETIVFTFSIVVT